jgi:hypothetical protein
MKENGLGTENPLSTKCRICNKHTRIISDDEIKHINEINTLLEYDGDFVKCLEASQQANAPIFADTDWGCKLWEAIP